MGMDIIHHPPEIGIEVPVSPQGPLIEDPAPDIIIIQVHSGISGRHLKRAPGPFLYAEFL